MKRLENLPQLTNEALGGLKADQAMKQRILDKASQGRRSTVRRHVWLPAACASLALVLALAIGLPNVLGRNATQDAPATIAADNDPLTNSVAAGSSTAIPSDQISATLTNGNVNVGGRTSAPAFRSLWAQANGGSFPMIGVNGRYYRMMISPTAVAPDLLGNRIGDVQQFTTEPALASTNVVMSNEVTSSTAVYEIRGMGSSLVAAQVNGSYKLFQRVSFNNNALRNNETFTDTLNIAGHITTMELSGAGIVDNHNDCERLFAILAENAVLESSGSISSQQSLLIELDNGLTVQMMVKNDNLSACGVWSCPEFFDAFERCMR